MVHHNLQRSVIVNYKFSKKLRWCYFAKNCNAAVDSGNAVWCQVKPCDAVWIKLFDALSRELAKFRRFTLASPVSYRQLEILMASGGEERLLGIQCLRFSLNSCSIKQTRAILIGRNRFLRRLPRNLFQLNGFQNDFSSRKIFEKFNQQGKQKILELERPAVEDLY